ncbi:MAG TPA: OB-fold domain-containing protein [Patescibacteria group bacterium]|nr:OB-fold domain-containing protein [Patescibacteria group bacterium]
MPQPVTYRGMTLIVPDNDSEWKEYFAHARQHRLMLRACKACGLMRYPPTHACPWCMDLGWTWKEVSGRGTIYSYEIVHHAIQPGFKDATPYAVVLVELDEQRGHPTPDEGLRIIGNLVKPDGVTFEDDKQVAIGRRVRVVFQDLAEQMALVQFALSDEPPQGRVWRLPE